MVDLRLRYDKSAVSSPVPLPVKDATTGRNHTLRVSRRTIPRMIFGCGPNGFNSRSPWKISRSWSGMGSLHVRPWDANSHCPMEEVSSSEIMRTNPLSENSISSRSCSFLPRQWMCNSHRSVRNLWGCRTTSWNALPGDGGAKGERGSSLFVLQILRRGTTVFSLAADVRSLDDSEGNSSSQIITLRFVVVGRWVFPTTGIEAATVVATGDDDSCVLEANAPSHPAKSQINAIRFHHNMRKTKKELSQFASLLSFLLFKDSTDALLTESLFFYFGFGFGFACTDQQQFLVFYGSSETENPVLWK